MKKKLLSAIMALILILSMSAMAFADTVPITEGIPADTMQAFIDDTPEGYYLAGTTIVPIDEDFTAYEAVYKPLVQPRYSLVTDSKTVYVRYAPIAANVIRSDLTGTFRYDGSTSACISASADTYLLHEGEFAGYTFEITRETIRYNGDQGYVDLVYKVYANGALYATVSNYKPTIACDPYGNVY